VVAKFSASEEKLKEAGYEVWNPVKEIPEDTDYTQAMRLCLQNLCKEETKAIAIQPDWYMSDGAKTEYMVAHSLELMFVYV
jgi:hypothetical protein